MTRTLRLPLRALALLFAAAAPAALPPPSSARERLVAARRQDDGALLQYQHQREELILRGWLGRWVAIADGELLPKHTRLVKPAVSLDALLEELERDHPKALHRYLWRVGEEGDVRCEFFAPNLPGSDALGMGLFQALDLAGGEAKVVISSDTVFVTRGSRSHPFPYGERGIPMHLADPTGARLLDAIVTPSSACDGTIVLSPKSADALGLARFEIPGIARYGPDEAPLHACRRARLRWRAPELDLDAEVTVAIWPD